VLINGAAIARAPKFKAFAMGISRSTVRSMRLYSICNPMNCVQPRNSTQSICLGDPPGGSVRDTIITFLNILIRLVGINQCIWLDSGQMTGKRKLRESKGT
jgi:hypothetical protein